MNGRFGDQCGITDCRFNVMDEKTKIRICESLGDTDFGGNEGGELCNFYKPKKTTKRKSR